MPTILKKITGESLYVAVNALASVLCPLNVCE